MGFLLNLILHSMVLNMMLSRAKLVIEAAQSLPGCLNIWGNIEIPYPFGTKNGSNLYKVDCEKPHIWKTEFQITADNT